MVLGPIGFWEGPSSLGLEGNFPQSVQGICDDPFYEFLFSKNNLDAGSRRI